MKIIVISDSHGYLPEIDECDLFIHAGDICPATNHQKRYQKYWLKDHFNPWLDVVPARHKVFIAGNHDIIFETWKESLPEFHAHYLENSFVEIEGLKIWGSPWSPFFCNWAFNFPESDRNDGIIAKACWDKIPDDIDLLVTHGPAYGYGDLTTYGGREHYGDKALKAALRRVKPQYHFFGHFHEGCDGEDTIMKMYHEDGTHTYCCNCSVVNERYIYTKQHTVITL